MGKFRQFLTELSTHDMSVFSFLDGDFSKCLWIFTKLGVCIGIVQTWVGIADRQISSIFDRVLPKAHPHFLMTTSVNVVGFSPNFVCALILLTGDLLWDCK